MKVNVLGNEVIVFDEYGRVVIRAIAATALAAIQNLLKAITPEPPSAAEGGK